MRTRLILLAALLCGCESDTTAPIAAQSGIHSLARLHVRVEIVGDQSLFGSYVVVVDGTNAQSLVLDSAASFAVSPGEHTLEIRQTFGDGTPGSLSPRCTPNVPSSRTVTLGAGMDVTTSFSFTCESLYGNGMLRLTLLATGETAPAEIEVILKIGIIRRTDHALIQPLNKTTDIPLPPNIYQLTINSQSCRLPPASTSPFANSFVIHPNEVLAISFTLTCT